VSRALVTGCAGFIGSHLVESLLADGWEVLGVDCFNANYDAADKWANMAPAREYDGFTFVEADLVSADLDALLQGCEAVFHLAAEPGVRASWGRRFDRYVHNNVTATQRLLEASSATRRFVYASSSSVYGDAEQLPTREATTPQPLSPYGVTKLAAEHLCQLYHAEHGVDAVMLRYFSVYGPRQRPDMAFRRFCEAAIDRRPIEIFGHGNQTRDFTFVADIVAATRAAASAAGVGGEIFNVGGGSRVTLNSTLERLSAIAGRPLDVRRSPREDGDVLHTGADISRAREQLAYEPSTTLEDGLGAEFEWALAARPAAIASAAARS
jgi:UDP-glucuronate 4-epimerase